MKTGTGSTIRCIYASAQALLVVVPVPLFISPDVGWGKIAKRARAHRSVATTHQPIWWNAVRLRSNGSASCLMAHRCLEGRAVARLGRACPPYSLAPQLTCPTPLPDNRQLLTLVKYSCRAGR